MEDREIIELFYERSEQAIVELSAKYGALCLRTASHMLNNRLDAEECVNDAYLAVWNTVPPQRPAWPSMSWPPVSYGTPSTT